MCFFSIPSYSHHFYHQVGNFQKSRSAEVDFQGTVRGLLTWLMAFVGEGSERSFLRGFKWMAHGWHFGS